MTAEQPQVFVSYTSHDRSVAEEVYRSLTTSGFRCWMAPYDITPGENYPRAIMQAIAVVEVFVLVYSGAVNQSRHVQGEVNQAFNRNLPILPFRIENVAPSEELGYFLGTFHWFDAFDRPWQEQLGDLSARIHKLVSGSAVRSAARSQEDAEPTGFDSVVREPRKLCGLRIGSYVLDAPLGAGGSGLVYRARHATLGQQVCVKLFYPVQADLARIAAAMQRGLRGLAAIQHPNVIRMIDQGTAAVVGSTVAYVVMELVQGVDLFQYASKLDGGGDLHSLQRRVRVARQIVAGMEAAHQCRFFDEVGFQQTGVLHGDLKPANILVRQGDAPVILDFMLADLQHLVDPRWREEHLRGSQARRAADELAMTRMADTCAFGTPGFMSWEQEQQGVVTVSSDIYSLGITLSLLFFPMYAQTVDGSGFLPQFSGRDLKAILDPDQMDPSRVSQRVFGGMETLPLRILLGRMISDDEERRPKSMQAVGEELARIDAELKAFNAEATDTAGSD